MATPTNQSIVKAFDIISLVCASVQARSLRELAAQAELSLASTHRILGTLKTVGAVRLTKNGDYELGSRIAALRDQHLRCQQDMRAAIQTELETLSRELRAQILLVALDHNSLMSVFAEAGSGDTSEIGNSYEPYFSAPGKMLLASLPSERLSDYIAAAPFCALTPATITDPAQLSLEIKRIRNCGYATDNEEGREGICGVAVALRDGTRTITAALGAVAGAEQFPQRITLEIVARLNQSAAGLERIFARAPRFGSVSALFSED